MCPPLGVFRMAFSKISVWAVQGEGGGETADRLTPEHAGVLGESRGGGRDRPVVSNSGVLASAESLILGPSWLQEPDWAAEARGKVLRFQRLVGPSPCRTTSLEHPCCGLRKPLDSESRAPEKTRMWKQPGGQQGAPRPTCEGITYRLTPLNQRSRSRAPGLPEEERDGSSVSRVLGGATRSRQRCQWGMRCRLGGRV